MLTELKGLKWRVVDNGVAKVALPIVEGILAEVLVPELSRTFVSTLQQRGSERAPTVGRDRSMVIRAGLRLGPQRSLYEDHTPERYYRHP